MEKLYKINRITVSIDTEEDDAVINLYKTNELVGTIHYEQLNLVSPLDSQLSKKAYSDYAKDVTINLIDNGGLAGYYYEEKQKVEGIKYDMSVFRDSAKEFIDKVIDIPHRMTYSNVDADIERYESGFIKNAQADFPVVVDGTEILVRCEIRSGQMCRPRLMFHNDNEYTFNITNVKRILS